MAVDAKTRSTAGAMVCGAQRAGLVAAALLAFAAPAAATPPPADEVSVLLKGRIPVVCEFGGPQFAIVSFGADLAPGASRSLGVKVNCNVPYAVTASSRFGALVTNSRTGGPGIVTEIPYELSFAIPTTAGAPASMDGCDSAVLKSGGPGSCARASSGEGVSLNQQAAVTITLRPESGTTPRAGIYADVIVMQIVPQV